MHIFLGCSVHFAGKEAEMGNEKKLKVYCETTFWSYLVGRQTTDEKIARNQAFGL